MNEIQDARLLAAGFFAPLDDLALLAATGEDAAAFLHAQLTNDVQHLAPGQARLAGYCTPKGRLMATLLLWRDEQAIWLQASGDLMPAFHKRLQMFVLRSKVKLLAGDAGPEPLAILGLGGRDADAALARWFPELPAAPYGVASGPAGTLVRVADAFGAPRYQWIAPAAVLAEARPALAASLREAEAPAWRLADIEAGVPRVTVPTQDRFVPQMVNFELLGGVNFKKGCYPGQEIVARSQYLGKLKRRMVRASVAAPAAAGMEIYSSADPGQPCGMVVDAAPDGGGWACLAETKLAALDEGTLHLGAADGPLLSVLPLPYSLDTAVT